MASGLPTLNTDQIAERGARMARRDDREYREYLSEEQRRQPGCPAREVVLDQRGQATSARVLLLIVLGGALTGVVASAQNAPAPLHIEKVRENLYVITGGRGTGTSASTVSGNTTVFVASSGVVLVDTKLPGFGTGILEQVRSVTPKPITMIINTHTHVDHTGGNPELPRNVEHIAPQ